MRWLLRPLVTADRVLNFAMGGSFGETLSARAHRWRLQGRPILADMIDSLFFWQPGHCQKSFDAYHPKE